MKISRDICLGAILAVIFVLIFLIIIPMGVYIPSNITRYAMSPDTFPKVAVAIIILMSIGIIVEDFIRSKTKYLNTNKEEKGLNISKDDNYYKIIILMVALLLFYRLIDILGIVLTSVLMIFSTTILFGERRLIVITIISLMTPISLYYFFVKVANVRLPLGFFNNLF